MAERFEDGRIDDGPRPAGADGIEMRRAHPVTPIRCALGMVSLAVAVVATVAWLSWRIRCLDWHPLKWLFLAAEILGLAGGLAIAVALTRTREHRSVYAGTSPDRRADTKRFAHAVADLVGRTRSADLHRDVRLAVRAAPRWRPRDWADVAIAVVLFEGPRRLLMVATVVVGLLVGVAPMPVPPVWSVAALGTAAIATSVAHVALGEGRIVLGDRTRWTYGAIGEILARSDHDDLAPRRWVGTVGAVVTLHLAVALRGMSDRWTHGLPPMDSDMRIVAMTIAVALAGGALATLATTPVPELPNAHLVTRRLEERTARQSAIGGAMLIGLIGFVAGVLPIAEADVPEPAPDVVDVVDVIDDRQVGPDDSEISSGARTARGDG